MNSYDSYNPWSEALGVYRKNAALVIGTAVLLHIVEIAVTFISLNAWGAKGLYVVFPFAIAIGQLNVAVYTSLMLHLRAGNEAPSIDRLIGGVLPLAPRLLWLAIVIGVGTAVGYMFFIIPGILISVRWALATPVVVATKVKAGDALQASSRLTEGRRGQTFGIMFVQGLLTIGAARITRAMFPDAAAENLIIVQALVASLVAPVGALTISSWYMHLAGYPPLGAPMTHGPAGTEPWGTKAAAPPGVWVPTVAAPASPASAPAEPAYAYGAPATGGYAPQPAQVYAPQPAQAYAPPPASVYAAQAQAPSPYGAPATHAAPTYPPAQAPYGAPTQAAPAYAAAAPSPYATPAAQPATAYAAAPSPYGQPAPASPYAQPAPAAAYPQPAAAPAPAYPQLPASPYAQPGPPPAPFPGPQAPSRAQSVAPPGM